MTIPETFRFFPTETPGQAHKQDWTEAYTAPTPVPYCHQLMKACGIHAKDGMLKELVDREALAMLTREAEQRPVHCVDLLSSYGNSFLAAIHGMLPEEIVAAWSTEATCITGLKPRRFPCTTLGVDLSKPALDYAHTAGIFDETMAVDINAPSPAESDRLYSAIRQAQFVHIGAPGYMEVPVFQRVIDAFAEGAGPGILMVAINHLFMKDHTAFAQALVARLPLVTCVGGLQRYLTPPEVAYFGVEQAYTTNWVMARPGR